MKATGQPARDRLLDDVVLSANGSQALIVISMTVPIRYVRHFPYEPSKELRISIELVAISPGDRDARFQRETMRPKCSDAISLQEVVYEGDIFGGPYVTLMLNQPQSFQVSQGRNSRSIFVELDDPILIDKLIECLAPKSQEKQ